MKSWFYWKGDKFMSVIEIIEKTFDKRKKWCICWVSMNDTMEIEDKDGNKYKITVEAVR